MTTATCPPSDFGARLPIAGQGFKVAAFRLGVWSKLFPAGVLNTLALWQQRSESRRRLGQLDDRLLSDVGLTRADIEKETRKFFWTA